jgi:hypothetical protein
MIRRSALLPTLALAACVALPASASAAPTQVFNAGAELLNQPAGAPWNINLLIGATFGTDDGSAVSPITHMKMSFPTGARFNGDKFKTCTATQVQKQSCPSGSKIGSGTATALLGDGTIDATITVYNGPGTASKRKVFMFTKALSTVSFVLSGDMTKTSGKFGYVLDLTVPPIVPELQPGGVAITSFNTSVGGSTTVKGQKIPLLTSPTSCKGGWSFMAQFTYANGSTGTTNSSIPCKLMATSATA